MYFFIVEPDSNLHEILREGLSKFGQVDLFRKPKELEGHPGLASYQLGIIHEDYSQGGILGWYKQLREQGLIRAPVIVMSSVEDAKFIEYCLFQPGVMDYIMKPLKMGELIARVQRATKSSDAHSVFSQSFKVFPKRRMLERREKKIFLTPTEFSIWEIFHGAFPAGISRDEIIREIWPGVCMQTKVFDVHLSNLRKKILCLGIFIHFHQENETYTLDIAKDP